MAVRWSNSSYRYLANLADKLLFLAIFQVLSKMTGASKSPSNHVEVQNSSASNVKTRKVHASHAKMGILRGRKSELRVAKPSKNVPKTPSQVKEEICVENHHNSYNINKKPCHLIRHPPARPLESRSHILPQTSRVPCLRHCGRRELRSASRQRCE